jgi:hypothetical protein
VIAREVPAYVLRGAFDWITSCEDSELIVQYVNANTPGASRFVEAPETGHGGSALREHGRHVCRKTGPFDSKVVRLMTEWL